MFNPLTLYTPDEDAVYLKYINPYLFITGGGKSDRMNFEFTWI